MKSLALTLVLFCGLSFLVNAQTPRVSSYNRSGITWIYAKKLDRKYSDVIEKVYSSSKFSIPSKYDDNRIMKDRVNQFNSSTSFSDMLVQSRIPNQVIDSIFCEKNGVWSYQKLLNRAKYTMNDAERKQFEATFVGVENSADRRWSEKLLQSNYIIVFDIYNAISFKDYYDEQDRVAKAIADKQKKTFEPVSRTREGYKAQVRAEIYKIVITPETLAQIYENCWADENSTLEQVNKARQMRQDMTYTLENQGSAEWFIEGAVSVAEAKRKNYSINDYFSMMVSNEMANTLLSQIEYKVESFKVKAAIFDTRPITVKIGRKEGIKTNRRFDVFENVSDGNGKVVQQRRGVIRARGHVTDNQGVATGDMKPTKFYQVEGHKLDQGMLVSENKDIMGIQIGGGTHGVFLRLDAFMPTNGMAGLKVYFDLNWIPVAFDSPYDKEDDKSTLTHIVGFGFGVSKEMYFLRNLFIAPYAGIQMEDAIFGNSDLNKKYKDDKGELYGMSNISYNVGGMFGFTVAHRTKLIFAGGFSPISFDDNKVYGKNLTPNYYIQRPDIKINVTFRYEL